LARGDSGGICGEKSAADAKFVRNNGAQHLAFPTNGSNFATPITNTTLSESDIHAQIAQIWRHLTLIYHILATKDRETNSGLNQHCGSIL
jgi:hypothetical protein